MFIAMLIVMFIAVIVSAIYTDVFTADSASIAVFGILLAYCTIAVPLLVHGAHVLYLVL